MFHLLGQILSFCQKIKLPLIKTRPLYSDDVNAMVPRWSPRHGVSRTWICFCEPQFPQAREARLHAVPQRPAEESVRHSHVIHPTRSFGLECRFRSGKWAVRRAIGIGIRGFCYPALDCLLALLTLIGGGFRFLTLARPVVWYDEAQTFRRVSGSFSAMMQKLRYDGFVPLHYWIEWGLGRLLGGASHLTPFWLRFFPAIAGTLMIPAMYGLARQFCCRRTALLVAAFTTCSAYMNIFSHDAKMYMPLWFFCTLSMTCLLVWSRHNGRVAWLGWVGASGIMVALHASGLALLAIQPLAYWVSRKVHGRRATASLLIGLAVIVAAPLCYYTCFNRWVHEIRHNGWDETSGLAWAGQLPRRPHARRDAGLRRQLIPERLGMAGIVWRGHRPGVRPEISPRNVPSRPRAVISRRGSSSRL